MFERKVESLLLFIGNRFASLAILRKPMTNSKMIRYNTKYIKLKRCYVVRIWIIKNKTNESSISHRSWRYLRNTMAWLGEWPDARCPGQGICFVRLRGPLAPFHPHPSATTAKVNGSVWKHPRVVTLILRTTFTTCSRDFLRAFLRLLLLLLVVMLGV